jgi:hypothetical protein
MRLSIIGTQPNQWSYGQDWLSMIPFFYRVTIIWARIRMSNSAGFSGRRMVSWDDGLPVLFTHGFQCEFIGPWMTGLIPSLPWNSSQSTSKAMFSCRASHQPRHSPRPCRRIRGQWFRMLYISLGVISLLFSFIFSIFMNALLMQLIVGYILGTQVVRTLTYPSLGLLILMWLAARALLYISAQASYCTSLACESSELAALFSVSHLRGIERPIPHASCRQLSNRDLLE